MSFKVLILAATPLPLPPPESPNESHALEILAIVTGAVLVFVAGAIWAVYFRKRRHRHHHHRHHHHSETEAAPSTGAAPEPGSEFEHHRRRHRRRRREHRHRNPTLAETGGMPPLRQEPPETSP